MKKKLLATALLALLPCYAYAADIQDEKQNIYFKSDTEEVFITAVTPADSLDLKRWHRDRPNRDWDDDRWEHDDDDYWDDDRWEHDDDDYWDDDRWEDDDDDDWDDDRWEDDDDDDWDDDDRWERGKRRWRDRDGRWDD